MASTVASDAIGQVRDLTNHGDDFLGLIGKAFDELIRDYQRGINTLPWFWMLEAGEDFGRDQTQSKSSQSQLYKVAS